MRIGIGYDVHRLVAGRDLVIGGVNIPVAKGLFGHSDAAGLADIGHLFPHTDDKFRGARSLDLLRQVADTVRGAGYDIVNIDAVVVAERPKLAPHVPAIKEQLAVALELPQQAVGIKATTTEGLGFEGDGLGMSAHAVALLQEK